VIAPFLVAVDPGLDAAGVSVFDLGVSMPKLGLQTADPWRPGESFQRVLGRLMRYEVIRTSPDWPLPRRLGLLARGLREIVPMQGCAHVLIERSRIAGVYARARQRQQTKNAINAAALEKLFFAIGALTAGAYSTTDSVELIPAPNIAKQIRQRSVVFALRKLDHPITRRARPSPDLLDSIWLGATWLAHPARREQCVA